MEQVLAKSKDIDYVVRGGRAYLANIPPKHLKFLALVLPKYFDKEASDWNIHTKGSREYDVLIARIKEFGNGKLVFTEKVMKNITKTEIRTRQDKLVGSVSAGLRLDDACDPITVIKGIKYSSICNCLSQMYNALSSPDFEKAAKTQVRAQVLCNLYSCGRSKGIIQKIKKLQPLL